MNKDLGQFVFKGLGFSPSGPYLRDKGMSQVLEHDDDDYQTKFNIEAGLLLRLNSEFTAEQVVNRIGLPKSSPNLVGACIRAFAKENKLVVKRYQKSGRSSRHAGTVAVWGRFI